MLGVFSMVVGEVWDFEVKVKAILHVLLFYQHFHSRNIMLESGPSLAVEWVCTKVNGPRKL